MSNHQAFHLGVSKIGHKLLKINRLNINYIVLLLLLVAFNSVGQTIRVQIEPYQARMAEVNITNDCLIQNDGYTDTLCQGPQNTNCYDGEFCGEVDVDVASMWKVDETISNGFYTDDAQGCGWHNFNSSGLAIDAIVPATSLIEVRMAGAGR